MRVVLINRSVYRAKPWSVHRLGCANISKDTLRSVGHVEGTFASLADAISSIVEDSWMQKMGFGAENIQIYPCTS